MSKVAEFFERQLHQLDDIGIRINPEGRLARRIDKLNADIRKCSVELNGQDWDGNVQQFKNPFPNKKTIHQSNASVNANGNPSAATYRNKVATWRRADNSCYLEVTY